MCDNLGYSCLLWKSSSALQWILLQIPYEKYLLSMPVTEKKLQDIELISPNILKIIAVSQVGIMYLQAF